jgi:hypothetical protein
VCGWEQEKAIVGESLCIDFVLSTTESMRLVNRFPSFAHKDEFKTNGDVAVSFIVESAARGGKMHL